VTAALCIRHSARSVASAATDDLVPFETARARCLFMAVRPEGAKHQWRKIPRRKLSIVLVADERLGRVTGWAGAS
jgi:hypothetical protein